MSQAVGPIRERSPVARTTEAAAAAGGAGGTASSAATDAGMAPGRLAYDIAHVLPDARGGGKELPQDARARLEIDDALSSEDADQVKEIRDYAQATVAERIRLLEILDDQFWVGPSDESAMERIWESFGEDLPAVAARDNLRLWDICRDRGAELDDLPIVQRMRSSFTPDVRGIAMQYLMQNLVLVFRVLAEFGLPDQEGPVAAATPEQVKKLASLQDAAAALAFLQKSQEAARQCYVGYNAQTITTAYDGHVGMTQTWYPARFDPNKPPDSKTTPSTFTRLTSAVIVNQDIKSYDEVSAAYDKVSVAIAQIVRGYPAVYGILQKQSSKATDEFVGMSPEAARVELAQGLHQVKHNISGAWVKLLTGDLNPLDLTPLHDQLYHGLKGQSGTDWTGVLAKRIAQEEVADHEFSLAMKELGMTAASQALIMLAPFTGGASLLVMLAGVAVAGVQWAMSEERYETLAQAAGASPTPGTELVSPEKVEAADAIRSADGLAFALAVITVGLAAAGAGISALTRARLAAAQRAALIAEVGEASTVRTARPSEVPYTVPPDVRVAKPGQPLALSELNPARRYLWIIDEDGNFRFADEGQAEFFSKRAPLEEPHPAAGETPLKHGDLAPGPEGQTRGAARAGGELRGELGADGKPTGRWIMNNDSSYTFNRTDAKQLGGTSLDAAYRLLKATGTDTSKITPVNTHGFDKPYMPVGK